MFTVFNYPVSQQWFALALVWAWQGKTLHIEIESVIITMIDIYLFSDLVDSESYLTFLTVDKCTIHMLI